MIIKNIECEDFRGNKYTEEAAFHLTEPELADMTYSKEGGLDKYVEKIAKEEDQQKIIELLKELILKSYGKISEDGKRFVKTEEAAKEFAQTNAYNTLFMEFATDAEKASEFVNGIVPKSMLNSVSNEEIEARKKEFMNNIGQ